MHLRVKEFYGDDIEDQEDEVKVDQDDAFDHIEKVAEEQPKSKVKSKQQELL